mgnify:CR=1 FL=1
MFDFEKLEVYQLIRRINQEVYTFLNQTHPIEGYIKDQWKRAPLGMLLNLAEGTGRISVND